MTHTCAVLLVPVLIYFVDLIAACQELNSINLCQTFETIQVPSIDFYRYSPTNDKYCRRQMDIDRWLYCICNQLKKIK